MSKKNENCIIFRQDLCILYTNKKQEVCSRDIKKILASIENHSQKIALFFDHPSEVLRVDHAPRALTIRSYLSWYIQKNAYIKEEMPLLYTCHDFKNRSLLISGFTEQQSPFFSFITILKKQNMDLSLHSYSINLFYALYEKIHTLFSSILCPLIIVITKEKGISIAFFIKQKIAYIKKIYTPLSVNNTLNDIIQHLENAFENETITPFFFVCDESTRTDLKKNFPESFFFYKEKLASFVGNKNGCLDQFVLERNAKQYYGPKIKNITLNLWQKITENFQRLTKILCVLMALNSAYTFFQFCYLKKSCKKMTIHVKESIKAIDLYQKRSNALLASSDLLKLENIRKRSIKQQIQLYEMIKTIKSIFGKYDKAKKLFINEKKSILHIKTTKNNPFTTKAMKHMFDEHFPRSKMDLDAGGIKVEIPSPFQK